MPELRTQPVRHPRASDRPSAEGERTNGAVKRPALRRLIAAVEFGLILAGLYSFLYAEHRLTSPDGVDRYEALNQLLSGGGFSSLRFPLVGPMFATPMWLLGHLGVAGQGPETWLTYYNLTLFSLGLLALYLLLRSRLEAALLRRFLLLLVAGTQVAAHVTDFYSEMFTALMLAIGALLAVAVVTHPALRRLGWVAMVLAGANTPPALPALGAVGALRSMATRRLRYLLPVVAAAIIILGENWIRRGDPFDQGYAGEGFDYPFFLGVLAILVSFGKGLVFFVPGMFLPVRQKMTSLYAAERIDLWAGYRTWLILVGGLAVVYAKWWQWSGDVYWGPRFLLIAIFPASLALAVWLTYPDPRPWANLVLLIVLALAIWVGANSAIFELFYPPNCHIDHIYCRFNIQDSRLWYPIGAWPSDLSAAKWWQFAYHVVVFLWMAAPVFIRLVRTTAQWLHTTALPQVRPQLRLRSWRF